MYVINEAQIEKDYKTYGNDNKNGSLSLAKEHKNEKRI